MALNPTTLPTPLAPSSLTHAIGFLTRPLVDALLPSALARLHSALRAALAAAYVPNRAARLVLAFGGPGSPPPPPVFAACVAARVPWAAWMGILAPRRFDLVIEPRVVSVEYPSAGFIPAQSVIVWSEASSVPRRSSIPTLTLTAPTSTAEDDEPQVPISKSRVHAALRATLHSAIARSQTRTLAQQLLAVEEEQEADELFAMLSGGAGILSPTPTRDAFPMGLSAAFAAPVFVPAAPAPVAEEEEASPASSRPSSRSSSFSAFSSVYDSDEESLTSASSVASFDFLESTKPVSALRTAAIPATTPVPVFARRVPVQPFVPRCLQQQPQPIRALAAAAVPAPTSPVAAAPRVFIDNTKKEVTKYLYQGGVSTVLTGGVMLGGGKASAPKATTPRAAVPKAPTAAAPSRPIAATASELKAAAAVPKYRAPIGSGRWGAPTHSFVQNTASAGSWRRAGAVAARA